MFPQVPVQPVDQLFEICFKRLVRELFWVLQIAPARISTWALCSCGSTNRAGIYSLVLWWCICILILCEVVAVDLLVGQSHVKLVFISHVSRCFLFWDLADLLGVRKLH